MCVPDNHLSVIPVDTFGSSDNNLIQSLFFNWLELLSSRWDVKGRAFKAPLWYDRHFPEMDFCCCYSVQIFRNATTHVGNSLKLNTCVVILRHLLISRRLNGMDGTQKYTELPLLIVLFFLFFHLYHCCSVACLFSCQLKSYLDAFPLCVHIFILSLRDLCTA